MRFSQGPPALMLSYQTPLKITDKQALRSEVDEIWASFRNDVENGKFTNAIISANEIPSGLILKSNRTYNFVFEKNQDGTWQCLDDKK
jgi:hypothetical protein